MDASSESVDAVSPLIARSSRSRATAFAIRSRRRFSKPSPSMLSSSASVEMRISALKSLASSSTLLVVGRTRDASGSATVSDPGRSTRPSKRILSRSSFGDFMFTRCICSRRTEFSVATSMNLSACFGSSRPPLVSDESRVSAFWMIVRLSDIGVVSSSRLRWNATPR